jgi:hypothetical protein
MEIVDIDSEEEALLKESRQHEDNREHMQRLWDETGPQLEEDDDEPSESQSDVDTHDNIHINDRDTSENLDDLVQFTTTDIATRGLQQEVHRKEASTIIIPLTCKQITAIGVTTLLQLPSGILDSAFANLSTYILKYGIKPPSNTSHTLTVGEVDPHNDIQTAAFALIAAPLQMYMSYNGTLWIIGYVANLKKKVNIISKARDQCCDTEGLRIWILNAAHSMPVRIAETIATSGFFFNFIVEETRHKRGFGGGDVWGYTNAASFIPNAIYMYGMLNANSMDHPYYPRSKIQIQALEELALMKHVAKYGATSVNKSLRNLYDSLKDPNIKGDELDKIYVDVMRSIQHQRRVSLWIKAKTNLALSFSSAVQSVAVPLKCWTPYSLINKLCYIADVEKQNAENIALCSALGISPFLLLGSIRDIAASYDIAMLFLDMIEDTAVQSYKIVNWGLNGVSDLGKFIARQSPAVISTGLGFLYFVPSMAFGYQRETLHNIYGGNCTQYENKTYCTGSYYIDDVETRFGLASVAIAAKIYPGVVKWFQKPLESTTHWLVNKFSNWWPSGESQPPSYSQELQMSLEMQNRITNCEARVRHLEQDRDG